MIRFACPQCHKGFQVEDKAAGKKTKCPNCGATLSVPIPAQAATPDPVPPLPVVKPVAAAATDDNYGLATQPTTHNQDHFWSSPAPPPQALVTVPSRFAPMPSQVGRPKRSSRAKGPSLALIGIGVVLLIGLTVGVTLWATGSLSKIHGDGKPIASTPSATTATKPPKTVWQKITAVKPVAVSGELFVTTKGGDVKKAAGQKVYFTPITPELQQSVVALLGKANQIKEDRDRVRKEGYAKYKEAYNYGSPERKAHEEAFEREYGPQLQKAAKDMETVLDTALRAMLAGATDAVADSEGKFKLELPPGKYVLWTTPRIMAEQSFSWCKVVEVHDAALNLILSEDSVFIYSHSPYAKEREPMHRLLREIASEIGAR